MNRRALLLVALAVGAVITGFVLEGASGRPVESGGVTDCVGWGQSAGHSGADSACSISPPCWRYYPGCYPPLIFSLDVLLGKLTVSGNALRRDGPQALEKIASAETDPLLRKGLLLLADGSDTTALEKALRLELKSQQQRDEDLLSILDNLGRLFADHGHRRCGVGADAGAGRHQTAGSTGGRHCHRLCGHLLWCGGGQSWWLFHWPAHYDSNWPSVSVITKR